MTKTIFQARVTTEGDIWVSTVDIPEIGDFQSEADAPELIDWHTRTSICAFTEMDPFDFEVHYEFTSGAPKYYLD